MTDTQPAALRLADQLDAVPETGADPQTIQDAAAELRRLHAYCQELESQVIFDCMTHIQNHAENEHVAGDVSKNGAESNMSAQQEAQEPCPTCAALARTVMLDQVSFDRKPDCYGIRQITDDEGVEEWEDIRTSPDVAREEANDMMATGRGEIYEVVPLWTTPKPSPTAQAAESVQDMQSVNDAVTIELPPLPDPDLRDVGTKLQEIKEFLKGYATEYAKAALAARAPAYSVLEDAARLDWLEQNLFHREKDEWDTKFGGYKEYNMWVLFSPKGIQGSARNIIDAAREQGADHDR